MNLGYTFDESILEQMSLEAFLDALSGLYTSVEIAPDPSLLPDAVYRTVVQGASSFHIHVPYFIKDRQFMFHMDYKRDFEKLFIIVDKLRQYSIKRPSVVLHGSDTENTLKGLDHLLNFVIRKDIDVLLTLENTDDVWTPQSVTKVIQEFDHDQMGFCYDVAHDHYGKALGVEGMKLDYVHLHGMDTMKHQSIRHLPLDIIKSLPRNVDINLELLKSCQASYMETLIQDLKTLKNSLWS